MIEINYKFEYCKPKNLCLNRTKGEFSINYLKKERLTITGSKCESCGRSQLNSRSLELDHIIPVKITGEEYTFKKENVQLLCYKCHKSKTLVDKAVIQLFKDIGVMQCNNIGTTIFIEHSDLIYLYKFFFELIKTSKERREEYNAW